MKFINGIMIDLYAWGETSPFMAGMRGNSFILVVFLFFWCPSWGLGLERMPIDER